MTQTSPVGLLRWYSRPALLTGLTLLAGVHAALAQPAKVSTYRFDFGTGKVASGYTGITPAASYTKQTGYGFDLGTTVTGLDRGGKDALRSDCVTSDKPFYFSVDLPEGNYNVTLGDRRGTTSTMLKAESRRLLLEKTDTKPGQFVTRTFTINLKNRRINGGPDEVQLKPGELTKLDWDDKLTLEFNGSRTCLSALEITPTPEAVTVFLAGNSTVVNQKAEPWAAWGQMLPRFFKPGVAVANHAESGLSLGSFLSSRRLEKVLSILKPGDYLFIEFGHNDQKEKGPDDGAYQSYTERLRLFVRETKGKGGIPVILTSTARRTFDEATGKITNSLGDYPDAARQVASQEGVALIDLNQLTTQLYETLGLEGSKQALVHYPANTFPGQTQLLADNTHFKTSGHLTAVKGNNGDKLSFTNGPVLVAGTATFTGLKHYAEPDGEVVEATYTGDLKTVRWKMLRTGWLRLEYTYALTGDHAFAGLSFSYPENFVIGAKWLGQGPYRAWKNRLAGTTLNVWENANNNTQTAAAPWLYPEFKGYFADIAWMEFNTVEGAFLVASPDKDLFVRRFNFYGLSGIKPQPGLPNGDISFLDAIPPIGTKLGLNIDQHPEKLGPDGETNHFSGATTRRTLYFYFGLPPTDSKPQPYIAPVKDDLF